MPDSEDAMPPADEWGGERRHRAATDAMVQARLTQVLTQQRDLREDIRRLRQDLDAQFRAGDERSFLIRRIDERVNELFTRVAVVEANYIRKEQYDKTVEPIRKWATWFAMTVIGAVLAGVLGLVINKGNLPH